MKDFDFFTENFGFNGNVLQRALIANMKIERYHSIMCSMSGGADSDIMLDMLYALDTDKKITYVFFDTGLEYQATKDHLDQLEQKYDIKIKRVRAAKTAAAACGQHGVPFYSKIVSKNIERLQAHGFLWEDEDFDTLLEKYCEVIENPKNTQQCFFTRANTGKAAPRRCVGGVICGARTAPARN